MRNTKYLFDEDKMSPNGMVSVSQIQTYLSCKKKWKYSYLDELKPRVERSYLTIGKLCHKGMQVAMQTLWQYQQNEVGVDNEFDRILNHALKAIEETWQEYMEVTPLLDEEVPEMNQILLDAKSIFAQALEEFEPWKYEVVTVIKHQKEIPALELHFKVPCLPTRGLHGFIDAILREKETGFIWCVDYKFRKALAPDDDEAFNIQNAVYSHACELMGIDITGTMTWQHCNTPASDPQVLKDGKISRAKIKTTWKHYAEFCRDNGQNPDDYEEEMKPKLDEIEWFRATKEYRNPTTVQLIWDECVLPSTKEIKSSHGKKANNFRSMYPMNCRTCSFGSLCQAELRDYDVQSIIEREYTKKA